MNQINSKQSEKASVATLKKFFNNTDSDEIKVEDIFLVAGRKTDTAEGERQSRAWLSNKLVSLRKDNLVKAIYSYEPYRVLRSVKLAPEGKRVLGRPIETPYAGATEAVRPAPNSDQEAYFNQLQQQLYSNYNNNYMHSAAGFAVGGNTMPYQTILEDIKKYNQSPMSDFEITVTLTPKGRR